MSSEGSADRHGSWYQLVLDSTNDAVLLVASRSRRIVDANAAAVQMYGYPRSELLALDMGALQADAPSELAERIRREWWQTPDPRGFGAEAKTVERQWHRTKTGQSLLVEISCGRSPVESESLDAGTMNCYVVRDVTESEYRWQLLFESEHRFRAIADSTYDWESWHAADGRLIWVNQAVQRLTGYAVSDCLEMSDYPLPLIHEEDRTRIAAILRGAGSGSSGNDVEFRMRHRTGEVRWMAVSWQPIDDSLGEQMGFRTSVRDIEERKQTEQALRESEERYRRIVDTAQEGIWILDARGRTSFVNSHMAKMLGYPPEAISGRSLFEFLHDDHQESMRGYWTQPTCSMPSQLDLKFRRSDGLELWTLVSLSPLEDDRGQRIGLLAMLIDITERHRMEEEIRRYADRLEQMVEERTARIQQLEQRRTQIEKLAALGQLAAGVAHEINNPLAGIRNAFELIKGGIEDDHPYRNYLELIDGEIERIGSIVHQMYQLYRPAPQSTKRFEMRTTVEEVVSLCRVAVRNSDVELNVIAQQELPLVQLPEGEVKQILYNLIRNAIQASPSGGRVDVELHAQEKSVSVSVRDEGPGMSAEVLSQIFHPFFTTKQRSRHAGMGLGLSVSQSLMEALGGRIDVKTQLDVGSTFTAIFPVGRDLDGQQGSRNEALE